MKESASQTPVVYDGGELPRGTATRAVIRTGRDVCGNWTEIPLVVVTGARSGPKLWLNGGTHGDEPEGAASIFKLLEQLDPAALAGTVVACPAMNVPAFSVGQRGSPADLFSYDMNRIYPGKENGFPTERVASRHYAAMGGGCDLQINIHSGGDHSYLDHIVFSADNKTCLELAGAMGPDWPVILKSATGSANPSGVLAKEGKAAISIELGGNCRTLTADFDKVSESLCAAYINVLRHYRMLPGKSRYASIWSLGHQETVYAPASGLWVGDPHVQFLVPTKQGARLGRILNLFGDEVANVVAPCDGMVAGLRARPSVLEGEWLSFYAVVDELRSDLVV